MAKFDHSCFETYAIADLPLNRDIYMMDEAYADDWECENIKRSRGDKNADPYMVGYVTPIHVAGITAAGADISWYPNTYDRFHEVKTFLPNDAFVTAALSYEYDKRIQLFVKADWLRKLHVQSNSVFALIDAVDMVRAIKAGNISHQKVIVLRDRLDDIASRLPHISFISFADSLLLKTNWTAGMIDSGVLYNYSPESLLVLFRELQTVYRETIGLEIYGVFAQGSNEYYDDPLLHISQSRNHISLNSLGLPFAQISLIEGAARKAIHDGRHRKMEIYMDEDLFNSLMFKDSNRKTNWPSAPYDSKMTPEAGVYRYAMIDDLLANFRDP